MPLSVNGANGITFADGSIQNTGASGFGFKNRIINGDMRIDQRNGGNSVSVNDGAVFCLDRWQVEDGCDGAFSAIQSSDVPTGSGFKYSLLLTVTTADTSIASNQYATFTQHIEGYNVADLNWGTANAQTVALSFWVKSSLVGTYTSFIRNADGSRYYAQGFTINSANTWEYKTVIIPGDTTGAWNTTNGRGASFQFHLVHGGTQGSGWSAGSVPVASGQVNWMATVGNTFYITGVQLEKGSTATAFDHRPYGYELHLCQRYCEVWNDPSNSTFFTLIAPNPNNNTQLAGTFTCVQKRALPTVTESSAGTFTNIWLGGASTPSTVDFSAGGIRSINVNITSSTNQGSYTTRLYLNAGAITSNYVIADAEL